jgi:carbon-monoxide dehydrogenase small subunit
MRVRLTVNGVARVVEDGWAGESLLSVLRERLGLTGTKGGCAQGRCGSCTVYLDGTPVCACLVPAGQADGSTVVTVEGLSDSTELHPVQEAFLAAGAVQCGFCTPGLIVSVHELAGRCTGLSDAQLREALAGHLCRCTGYAQILDAARTAVARGAA